MPARLSAKNATTHEIRVLDEMSDGQWHPVTKITRNCAQKGAFSTPQVKDTVSELVSKGYLVYGANNSYRMMEKHVRQWRTSRGLSMETKDSHSPRFFGGILEDDGWALAPLSEYELLNFRANSHITSRDISTIIEGKGDVSQVEDGLFRILTKDGDQVYALLKDWDSDDPSANITGLRLTYNTFRRDIKELPPRFLDDLCEFYGRFSYVLLRNSMSSIRKHLPEADDIQQQIYLWVIDAVARYDDTTCIPFAAYLHSCLQRWVHNLNRKSHGRAAADNELKHSRAIATFETEHGRKPSLNELASVLGESVEKVTKESMSIALVASLRSTTTIDSEDFTVPLVAEDSAEATVESALEKTLLSAALITAALEADERTSGASLLALMSVVDRTWYKGKRLTPLYRSPSRKSGESLSKMEANLLESVGTMMNRDTN